MHKIDVARGKGQEYQAVRIFGKDSMNRNSPHTPVPMAKIRANKFVLTSTLSFSMIVTSVRLLDSGDPVDTIALNAVLCIT